MEPDLRQHFDRAVGGDPGADPGEMARTAIVAGGRVRRRRRQLAAAGAAAGVVLAFAAGVALRPSDPSPVTATPPAASTSPEVAAGQPLGGSSANGMVLVAAVGCSELPVTDSATDAVIFPGDSSGNVTDSQLAELGAALRDDPRVGVLEAETREQAYEKFRKLWADSPEFVQSIGPEDLPPSFRVRLVDPGQYTAFRTEYEASGRVGFVEGRICPPGAPVGGVR